MSAPKAAHTVRMSTAAVNPPPRHRFAGAIPAGRTLPVQVASCGREVLDHYDACLKLGLSDAEKGDLVEYLKSL